MSLLLASVPQDTVTLSGGTCRAVGFDDPQTATLDFDSSGIIYGMTTSPTNWFNVAPQVGAGALYEIYATRTAGYLPDTGTVDTWLALTSGQIWTLTQSGVGEKTSTLNIKIRLASTGAIMAQGNYSFTARVNDVS